MGALSALRRSPGALASNPVILVPILVIGLLQLPQFLLQATDPVLASLFSVVVSGVFIFVMPFFQGGIIGMADESLEGRTRLGTIITEGKANYVNLLVAYLLLLGGYLVLGFTILSVAIVGGIVVLRDLSLTNPAVWILGGVLLLFVLAVLTLMYFLQFYQQAIVLDDHRAIAGIKHSAGLVRRNLLSVLGYTIIAGVIGGILGLGLGVVSMLTSPRSSELIPLPQFDFVTIAGIAFGVIIVGAVIGGVLAIYSVAFYRDLST